MPADSRGRPLTGAALEGHLRRQAELTAAAEAREDIAALARTVARLAAREMAAPAPDALAALGSAHGADGRADALRVLRCAGISPEPQRQRWAGQAPLQASSRTGPMYTEPEHHPRVTAAVLAGASMAEVAALIAEVAAEREASAETAPADRDVLWVTRTGAEVRQSPGAPVPLRAQVSMVRNSVPELGSEPVALGGRHE